VLDESASKTRLPPTGAEASEEGKPMLHKTLTWLAWGILTVGAGAAEPGLVAHWTFDEAIGSTVRDVTGNGHDATVQGATWIASPRGHALRLDSRDDLVTYGQVDTMNLSGDATLAVWLRTSSAVEPRTNRLIFGDTGPGVERNVNLRMDGYGHLRFEWGDGRRNASLLADAGLLGGTWKHVVVACDWQARRAAMYVDGSPVASMTMPLAISPTPVKQRITGWFYNGYFAGDLDDVRLYSRALSATEVKQLFAAEADLQIGIPRVLYDASRPEPRGIVSVKLHNLSDTARRVEIPATTDRPAHRVEVAPGAEAELLLAEVGVKRVWKSRNDLLLCESRPGANGVPISVWRGDTLDVEKLELAGQLVLEPLQVHVADPWQRQMPSGKTEQLSLEATLALPAEQRRQGTLRVRLVSRQSGKEALTQQFKAPQASMPLRIDARSLPWGAYDVTVRFDDATGKELVSTKRVATVLPGGKEQIRVLNNLVSELMDARSRGLVGNRRIEFMNPRHGWVWFRAAGDGSVRLDGQQTALLTVPSGEPAVEAMRLLPAGKHKLEIEGSVSNLVVHAIPALVYNVYPSQPQIQPFGANTWERLAKRTLPNVNMIEGQVLGTPESDAWRAQGKSWLANVSAPGLHDQQEWTVQKMLDVWRKPRGFDLAGLSGIQVDEYYSAMSADNVVTTALSAARLAEDPSFAGKLWIPFVVGMYGNQPAELLMKTTRGAGWPYSIEVYVGEMPTEAENLQSIRGRFLSVAQGWEKAYPGAMRQAIFTPMYAYLPYCTSNRCPQADFRVHLQMQMQVLATDPAFFGLWGVQPYRSNYVDEEILNCTAALLRHYCIEGRTDRLLTDPYELEHVADPDFAQGTAKWQVTPAAEGAVRAGQFAGYGNLQGRYPSGAYGDTFLILKRTANRPNVVSQQVKGLEPGRRYSLKLYTGDYQHLQGGMSEKQPTFVTLRMENAEVLPGAFDWPFRSARGPSPFTRDHPFWMTYHWLPFRARGPTAKLTIHDWQDKKTPGGPIGQQTMVNFVELQPVFAD
jgi:hypothetical protein